MRRTEALYLRICWVLLLLMALFPIAASLVDVAADMHGGIPTDHADTFAALTGISWPNLMNTAPGIASYVTLLEYGYALHELVLGVLFTVIVAVPFRRRERWAWWTCWVVLLADVTYSVTFGAHDGRILRQSLVADIALPLLLLAQIPAFFGYRSRSAG